jgi:hypothetical protein
MPEPAVENVWPSEKVRWLVERSILPLLTALVAYCLLHGRLKALAERIPEPYADLIAHPIVDNLLYALFSAAYFIVGFLNRKLGKWALAGLVAAGILQYSLVNYLHVSRFSALLSLLMLVGWAADILLLFTIRGVSREYEDLESESASNPWPWEAAEDVAQGNYFTGMQFVGRLTGVSITLLLFKLLYIITALTSSTLLGIALRSIFGESVLTSEIVSLCALALLVTLLFLIGRRAEN